ncbi:MAG: carboxy terminal-processing peptidase [Raineya sp.]|nr:carboxy terminal-processing peptidase [Raineya sp.]
MKKFLVIIPVAILTAVVWSLGLWKKNADDTPTADLFQISKTNKIYCTLDTNISLRPNSLFEKKATTVVSLIVNRHFKRMQFDDTVSANIFDNFIEEIDENKLYLLQSDIDDFKKYRLSLDDELRQEKNNLNTAYYIYNIYLKRVYERLERNKVLIKEKYDFTADEYYETDRKKISYPKTLEEADKEWRKLFKNSFLEAKMIGETPETTVAKLEKRYDTFKKNLTKTTVEDVFQTYMNALAMAYDPHTNYFSPVAASNFNMSMNRSLEGIGATLASENDYITIREVRPGGPAFKSKKIFKNDRIIGVAQGDDGEMVDVIGWRVDEAIQLIRGKQGTVVRLKLLPASEGTTAKPMEVRMVREKITFEETSSTKQIIEFEKNKKKYRYGVIGVPAFYINFDEYRQGKPDYKSTTNDVKKILEELKTENVDGVIIDLRYNGGGSLKEAIDLTSLFIKGGAVVQVKDANGRISVGDTDDFEQVYNGPLIVMTNRFSASASEIFSGAIQDYKRGIIVGESTYGKGTVQNIMDLSKYIVSESNNGNVGQLNLTVSKYYRAAGSSVQNKGVIPDILLPTPFEDKEFSEASYKTSLPWDEIAIARSFKPTNEVSEKTLKGIQSSFQKRMKSEDDLKKLIADTEKARKKRQETRISLNEAKRKAEKEASKNEQKLTEEEEEPDTNDPNKKKLVESFVNLKDLYLKNAIQIVYELSQTKK